MGICHYIENLLPAPDDHQCCVYHLTACLIESLRPGAIRVDAVNTASWTIGNDWKAVDAYVVGLCEIACAIVCNPGDPTDWSQADDGSVDLEPVASVKGTVPAAVLSLDHR